MKTLPQPTLQLKAVTIAMQIAPVVECLTQATIGRIIQATDTIVVPDSPGTLSNADANVTAARALRAEIEAQREQIKKPFLDGGRAVDAAAKPALEALDAYIDKQKGAIAVWNAEVRRLHAEAVAKAEAEARRLQEEENKRVREAQRLADEQAAAERKRLQDEADAQAEILGTPEVVVPIQAVAVPIIAPAVFKPAFVAPPAVSKAVSSRIDQVVEIIDAKLIPHEIGGIVLMSPDLVAIKRLLLAKATIPGCRLIEVSTPVARKGA